MKRLTLKALLIASVAFIFILGLVYSFLNEWNVSTLTYRFVQLSEMYIAYMVTFISTLSFEGTTSLIILSVTAFAILIGFVAFIRGFIVRRPLSGLMAFLAINAFFAIGVSLIIVNPDLPNGRFIYLLINGLSSDFIYTLFLGGMLGFILLSLLMIFLLGITTKAKVAKKVSTVKLTPTINQPLPVQPTLQTAPVTPSTNQPATGDNLSELVKVVMQEELNMMRNTQQIYPVPNMGVAANPYASSIDLNLVRRIVIEELAKFQGQYISRAEAQALIAQEIAMIKAQLRIK
ncbi:MAG: hypothetical protein RL379_660 [Bacillota bacterium]